MKYLDENGLLMLARQVKSKISSSVANKQDKATTLAGYGITDAKINNGVITLGSNTITPLTSHQDITGKADLSGATFTGNITVPKIITSTGLEIY